MKPLHLRLGVALLALLSFQVSATTFYVDVNSASPTPPYTNWITAATNIQDAIDASTDGDQILVTNGVYQSGGRVVYGSLTNRVVINRAVTVQSINGPAVTTIQGSSLPPCSDSAVRGVYLTNMATLAGFTIANGSTRGVSWPTPTPENCGGGVWGESVSAVISNCVLVGNTAYYEGGGAYGGTLNDCTLTNNSTVYGGGAGFCTLNNCTLINNLADAGGGAADSTLDTCTITKNGPVHINNGSGGGVFNCTLNHSLLMGNGPANGGGARGGTLNSCVVISNTGNIFGGGAAYCILNNCEVSYNLISVGNTDVQGGGTYGCTLNNCTIFNNQAVNRVGGSKQTFGGGVSGGVLNNCLLFGNKAPWMFGGGGGAYNATLINCTVVGNSTAGQHKGDGIYNCTATNSIVCFNGVNYQGGTLNYCCTRAC